MRDPKLVWEWYKHRFGLLDDRRPNPAHAAIILSLETVFAALAGWLLLGEVLGGRELLGCGLMLAGMLLSQLRP